MNKRGQGLSTTAIILIVLGVILLIVLALGFTLGFSKIFPFLNPPSNVKQVVDKCSVACNSNAKFDYCTVEREVKVAEVLPADAANLGTKFKATCRDLSESVGVLGVGKCPPVTQTCEGNARTLQDIVEFQKTLP